MQFLFSTTLLVQKSQVLYQVYREEGLSTFLFQPAKYSQRVVYPPQFSVSWNSGKWEFNNLVDHDLKEQAIDDIRFYLDKESSIST